MSSTLSYLREKVDNNIQDTARILEQKHKDSFITDAIRIYSQDRPQEKVKDTDGDGASYDFALPSDWVADFSGIVSRVEYPAGEYQSPVYIDDNSWVIYKTASGSKFRFTTFIPSNSSTIRYTYSLPHSTTTISEQDKDAVASLAAALCCRALAAYFSQTQDSTIDADAIDYARKTDDYVALATILESRYNNHLGKGTEAQTATGAIAIKDLDRNYQWGTDFLTHPAIQR